MAEQPPEPLVTIDQHTRFRFPGMNGRAGLLSKEAKLCIWNRNEGIEPFDENPEQPKCYDSDGIVLVVDISSYTTTALALDANYKSRQSAATATRDTVQRVSNMERVPKPADDIRGIVNTYMDTLGDICVKYGGEVSELAGDAMICIWKIEQDLLIIEQDEGRPFFRPRSMNEARLLAQKASAKMLEECVALNSRFTNLATINIHGGLAEGTLWHMDLVANLDDGARKRWSVMLGKPLTLAGKLLNFANGGEIVSYLDGARDLVLGERGELRQPGEANQPGPQVTRDTDQLSVILADSEFDGNIDPIAQDPRNAIDWTTWFHDRGLDDAVNEYIATTVLEYFALPPAGDGPPQGDLVDATIMFVGLSELVPTTDAFNSESMQTFMDDNLPRINEAYEICLRNACTRETFSDHENEERVYQGDIVNFLFDDKGCSFIARFPDHLPLKQALRIKNDLRANHTPSKAAITYGNTFYGFSGAQNHRYTFTTLSVHTNDAARLCYSPRLVLEENTIAIDDAVARKLTNNERSYGLAGAIKRGATPRKRAIKKVNQFKSKGTRSEVYHFYSLNVWHYLRSFHENLELERTPTLAHVFSWRIIEAQSHNLERFEYGHMLDAPEREEQEPAPGVLEGIFAFFQGFIQELG